MARYEVDMFSFIEQDGTVQRSTELGGTRDRRTGFEVVSPFPAGRCG